MSGVAELYVGEVVGAFSPAPVVGLCSSATSSRVERRCEGVLEEWDVAEGIVW